MAKGEKKSTNKEARKPAAKGIKKSTSRNYA